MKELDLALDLAQKAGKEILKLYESDAPIEEWKKQDKTCVTKADLVSNEIIMEGLKKAFGNHAIMSEETDDDKTRFGNEHLWIFDPLDGTADFKQRNGGFSIMIAYLHKNTPVVGVVYAPTRDTIYYAERGKGAFSIRDGETKQLRVTQRDLDDAVLVLSRKDFTQEQAHKLARKFEAKGALRSGSFGVKVALILEGRADFYINNNPLLGEWDTAAPELILSEAGGKTTDYDGKPLTYNKPNPLLLRGSICSTKAIHDLILANVEKYVPLKKSS